MAEVRRQKSALHMAISHFYHDSYFRRFRSVYNLRLLLLTFDLWFVTSKLQWLQHAFPAIDEREISLPDFYHNSYFRRFRSVCNLRLLLLTFDLWFVTSQLQWLQQEIAGEMLLW